MKQPDSRQKFFMRPEAIVLVVLFLSLSLKMCLYTPYPPAWDGAAYLSMGKYLFSSGRIGFIEPFRPVLWPALLGVVWKVGLDPVWGGKALVLLFSLGSLLLVYQIGKDVYDKTIGLVAAVFFSFSFACFYAGNTLYAEMPSSFFGLLCVFLFFRKRFFWAGVIGAVACWTKFTQAIPVFLLSGICFFQFPLTRILRDFWKFAAGFILMVTPIFIFNFFMFKHALYPFIEGKSTYSQLSFVWTKEIVFCLRRLVKGESWLFLFVPFAFLPSAMNRIDRRKIAIFVIGVLSFAWVGKLPTNIPRFFITALPYLYLAAAAGFVQATRFLNSKGWRWITFLGILVVVFLLGGQLSHITKMRFPENRMTTFQRYLFNHEKEIQGNVWISTPKTTGLSDIKVQELMYYPVFDVKKINDLLSKIQQADYILYDARLLLCRPKGDVICEGKKVTLEKSIETNGFIPQIQKKDGSGRLLWGIFKRY